MDSTILSPTASEMALQPMLTAAIRPAPAMPTWLMAGREPEDSPSISAPTR